MGITKRKEAFVIKGQRQIQEGKPEAGLYTVAEGLDYYSERILNALNGYASEDSALVVSVLRNLASSIEEQNPDGKALTEFINKNFESPGLSIQKKVYKTRKR